MFSRVYSCVGIVVLALSACSSEPVKNAAATPGAAPNQVMPSMPSAPSAAPGPTASSTVTTVDVPPYLDPANQLSRDRSVFFDFDSVRLDGTDNAVIERHGRYLAGAPRVAVRIEGNTDERGGAEYNLALGQRRAEAVAQGLRLLGVKPTQMEVVSWGEEKPRSKAHDESAWAQNRRADIVYPNR